MRKIRLALDHTQAGEKYYAGMTIELPNDVAERVAQLTGALRSPEPEPEPEPQPAPKIEPTTIEAEDVRE